MVASGRIWLAGMLLAWAYGSIDRISIWVAVVPISVQISASVGQGGELKIIVSGTFSLLLLVGPGGPKVRVRALPRWA